MMYTNLVIKGGNFRIALLSVFIAIQSICYSQPPSFHTVDGLPTREIYDLMVDKKGFLWIGHNMGLSRYDGIRFKHFSNPEQASLSLTDLTEDNQGRVWCHNYSGQVFFVENEKLELLKQYDSKNEINNLSMLAAGDKLIITSGKGLFICNTSTLKCSYIHTCNNTGKPFMTSRLVFFNNKIVINESDHWFTYDPGKDDGKVNEVLNINPTDIPQDMRTGPLSEKDTLIAYSNGMHPHLFKIIEHGGKFEFKAKIAVDESINCLTQDNDKLWVHTRTRSFNLTDSQQVLNSNLTNIVTDHEGNQWAASLFFGLMVKYKYDWEPFSFGAEDPATVRSLAVKGNDLFIGCQNGRLIVYDVNKKHVTTTYKLTASVEGVFSSKYGFIISTAIGSYFLNNMANQPKFIEWFSTKGIVDLDSSTLLASASGLRLMKYYPEKSSLNFKLYRYPDRFRSVAYDSSSKITLVAANEGVYKLMQNRLTPVLYDHKPVYSCSINFRNGMFYISSFNGSVFSYNGRDGIKLIGAHASGTSVYKSFLYDNTLWSICTSGIEAFDIGRGVTDSSMIIPVLKHEVYDLLKIGDKLFAATSEGLFTLALQHKNNNIPLQAYINLMRINDTIIASRDHPVIPVVYNNFEFEISAPWFSNPSQVYFKYRLSGAGSGAWNKARPMQRNIRFSGIDPGDYQFEAIAVNSQSGYTSDTLYYSFTIPAPWYKTKWFMALVIISLQGIMYGAYKYRQYHRRRIKTLRKSITADLHDDIGATLSSINIYSELAKSEKNNSELLDLIQNNTMSAITNLDEMVWNISGKEEQAERFVDRMEDFVIPFLAAKNIRCYFNESIQNKTSLLPFEKARNIYFMFKELVNNIARHSSADECTISISEVNNYWTFTLVDNGKGFDPSLVIRGSGLKNIKHRADQIKALYKIHSSIGNGSTSTFEVQL